MANEVCLGEIAEIIMGQSPPGESYNETGEGLPFFQGVADFNYRFPIPRVYCTAPSRVAKPGDIMLSVRAPIGRVNIADRECAIGRGLCIIRPYDAEEIRYLEFVLRAKESQWNAIEGNGSVFGNATRKDLEMLGIPWPEWAQRRAIAHILGRLDDKIELNRRMSQMLEQMARALFKAWFVDFEPVRAKLEGRWRRGESLPGLPAHLYDLFPDRLVNSELGEIPEGWEVRKLGDVLGQLITGARPKGGAVEKGLPSIGAENVIGLGKYDFSKEKYIPERFFEKLKHKGADVRPKDILLYKDGAYIGRKTYFEGNFPHAKCAVNEHVFILRAQYEEMQRYLFFWLDQDWMTQEIIALNTNSAQPGINQDGVKSLSILLPPKQVVITYDVTVAPLVNQIFILANQSRTLAAMRDTLLPKLISGELRVKDAERFLKERGL